MTSDNTDLAQLNAGLDRVQSRLHASLADLHGPLGELVRSQLQNHRPFVRAATVLTTAYCLEHAHAQDRTEHDHESLSQRTIALAAALEILHMALSLHKRLVQQPISMADAQQDGENGKPDSTTVLQDKTVLGGTILAGDYCFSRASQLAAQTENPRVVAHFAQTLQNLSEGLLRTEFEAAPDGKTSAFDVQRALLVSGIEATFILFDRPVPSLSPSSEPPQPAGDCAEGSANSGQVPAHGDASQQTETQILGTTGEPDSEIMQSAFRFVLHLLEPPAPNGNGYHPYPHPSGPTASPYATHWAALHTWQQTANTGR